MAQTINVANIRIGMNADGGEFLRGELRSMTATLKQSEPSIDKFRRDMGLFERALREGAISITQFVQAENHLIAKYGIATQQTEQQTAATKRLSQATQDASRTVDGQAISLRSLQAAAGQYIGIAAGFQAIKKSVGLASELESNKIALEVMTGSASKAESILSEFKRLDVQSPLNYGEFLRAGKTLMGFGVQSMEVASHLERLAAISLGDTAAFQSLSLAFGQVSANGRLMGGEVLQMINAGFNPLQEISRTTGISMVELKKRMENGAVSAEMVAKAFQTATSEGGLFFGMNEKLAGSMSGQFSKMEGDIKAAAIAIGNDLLPLLKQSVSMLRGLGGDGGSDGERNIVGFNIKLAADAYSAMLAGIGTSIESASKSVRNLDLTSGLVGAVMDGLNATLDKSQEIKDAELDREAALIRAANQEGEIAKKKAEQVEEAKKLAEAEMQKAKAESDRAEKHKAAMETQKKVFGEMSKLREEYDKLTIGEEKAKSKKQSEEFSTQDMARIENMKKLVETEKKRKSVIAESAAIEKEMMTDKQKALAEIERLRSLYSRLTPAQQDGAAGRANLAKQAKEKEKMADPASDIAKNIAPAFKAGSREAFTFLLSQRTDAAEKAERKKWQDSLLEEAKKANQMAEVRKEVVLAR